MSHEGATRTSLHRGYNIANKLGFLSFVRAFLRFLFVWVQGIGEVGASKVGQRMNSRRNIKAMLVISSAFFYRVARGNNSSVGHALRICTRLPRTARTNDRGSCKHLASSFCVHYSMSNTLLLLVLLVSHSVAVVIGNIIAP